ncbi:MAG TPA: DTW domain-containing protein [Polyangia bacterium]|jgi:DTW domain-containing protein YfiP|nr:DTW domain-containing protein [Polyangia bacterium]
MSAAGVAAVRRAMCAGCGRPVSVCLCAYVTPLQTRTRVLLLQHPRERHVAIGTARLARLGLPGAMFRRGVEFDDDPEVQAVLSGADGGPPPYVLFPGRHAVDLAVAPPPGPITLIVVDGTWWQAKKLLNRNPALAALPQLRLAPASPSRYRIRREPRDECVATIEALAMALGALEGDPARFATLLRPFEAMVDKQLQLAATVRDGRHRRSAIARHARGEADGRPRPARRIPLAEMLRTRGPDLLCVHGEANAWPARPPSGFPPEIVQWMARRLSTGETFSALIAPRGPLAPSTRFHLRLTATDLAAGEPWEVFRARWLRFVREEDVFCSWGRFPVDTLLREDAALLPGSGQAARVDVRAAANAMLGTRIGAVEDCASRLDTTVPAVAVMGAGRAGPRLAALCGVVQALAARRDASVAPPPGARIVS